MKKVRMGNKCLCISDEDLDKYLADGYDEIDENGKVKTTSPTKKYSATEVDKIKADYEERIKKLEAKLSKAKKGGGDETGNE